MSKRKGILIKILKTAMLLTLITGVAPSHSKAADIPKYHSIPAYQQKDIYATETVKIRGITVEEVEDGATKPIEKPVKFKIFNSTKQEVEQVVQSSNGVLPDLSLIKNHNYIIFAEDSEYEMPNVYIWVKDNGIVNIKKNAAEAPYDYPEVTGLQLSKRESLVTSPEDENRVFINLPVKYGEGLMYNVKFNLVSAVETISVTTGNSGKLRADLLEDVTYMVTVENNLYDVESFPIAVKDKSEYGAGKYTYDHSNCHRVEEILLVDKKDAHKNDTAVTSLSGGTTVEGINFSDFLVIDKKIDKASVKGLDGNNYDVIDIKIVNPHRWEVSKLATGEFHVTEIIDGEKKVSHVYCLDNEKTLQEIEFDQIGNEIYFTLDSLSLHPVVVEYEPIKVTKVTLSSSSEKIAAGKSIQLKAVVAPSNASNKAIEWMTSNKKYATVSSNGKVTLTKAGAGKTVKITARATDGSGKEASCKIKIMKHAVKSIKLTAKKTAKAGKKVTVKASVKTTGKDANKKLNWTVSNPKYATVNSKGVVTTKKAGKGKTVKVTVKATDGSGKKKTVRIKIK
ncbi:MAG: Ig domain-containing protein [Lachnospiraceae bacterium]